METLSRDFSGENSQGEVTALSDLRPLLPY